MTGPKHDDGGPASMVTLRDYFAAQALAGILANDELCDGAGSLVDDAVEVAEAAYTLSDAMLSARARRKGER